MVLKGDASERKILMDGDVEHADALVAMTSDDKTNLMICEVAKDFKVPKIISRVNSTDSEEVFMKLGITASINTTTSVVYAFKKALEKPEGKRIFATKTRNEPRRHEIRMHTFSRFRGQSSDAMCSG